MSTEQTLADVLNILGNPDYTDRGQKSLNSMPVRFNAMTVETFGRRVVGNMHIAACYVDGAGVMNIDIERDEVTS